MHVKYLAKFWSLGLAASLKVAMIQPAHAVCEILPRKNPEGIPK